ncbi:hypothetical protein CAPTEDRAFT_202227 [Capitella teleta]|uniref:Uncharacterized protein n=1 Tax=Capitella teleta TaxID=283909 RepID=R7V8P7_CAPTE|nr:hypothetical protein CAPTEDRAFT_202227 [Capitella teleta]|eukprot:ELU12125.1 hypothetical protein CAPTEDRAFT_202227 [Capitella teleta]
MTSVNLTEASGAASDQEELAALEAKALDPAFARNMVSKLARIGGKMYIAFCWPLGERQRRWSKTRSASTSNTHLKNEQMWLPLWLLPRCTGGGSVSYRNFKLRRLIAGANG